MVNNWIFLSHYYDSKTPGYGGKVDFVQEHTRCTSNGDKCNQFKFTMSNHVGTHIDLPFHFCGDGKKLEEYSPTDWLFNFIGVVEIDVELNELIFSKKIPKLDDQIEVLILKTNFEVHRNNENYWKANPGLSAELGHFLKEKYKKLKVIGFDFISATSYGHKEEGVLAHRSFLGSENGSPILIVEDMKLSLLKNNKIDQMFIAPLLIRNADGVPVTIYAKI